MLERWHLGDLLVSMGIWERSCEHTFEIGHVCPNIRIQGVDHHLPVYRAGDLHTPVGETWSGGSSFPCITLANVLCLREEVREYSSVQLGLANNTLLEKSFASWVKGTVHKSEKDGSFLAQDLFGLVIERAENVDVLEDSSCIACQSIHCRGCSDVYIGDDGSRGLKGSEIQEGQLLWKWK
jgi:hypothetical protein